MKAKPTLTAFIVLLSFALLFSCHKDQQQQNTSVSLAVSTQALIIDSAIGATDTFRVTSNVPWSITVSPDSTSKWLQVSPTQGTGNATVHLTVTAHNPNTSQPVTLSVGAPGHAEFIPWKITLSQTTFLQVDTIYTFLAGTGGNHSFKINTNSTWQVAVDSPWVHFDATQGTGPGALKVTVDTNRSGVGRTAHAVLYSLNNPNVTPVQLQITQYGVYLLYNFSPASGTVGTTVTLKGVFPRNPVIYMGTARAAVISHDSGTIVYTVPAGATGQVIEVADTTTYQIHSSSEYALSSTPFLLHGGWNLKNNFPTGINGISQNGMLFSWRGDIYNGFGTSAATSGPIYRFDTASYKWSAAITLPAGMSGFFNPIYYILNDKLYVGGDNYQQTSRTFWEYDLTKGNDPTAWRQLTAPPDQFNYGFAFTDGTYGYAMSGQNTGLGLGTNTLYRFSTTGPSDPGTWTSLVALGVKNAKPSGFTIGNTTYFGGGGTIDNTQVKNFWSMTPPSTTMTPIASFPEDLGSYPYAFPVWTIGNIGYLFNFATHNISSYDPSTNSWTQLSTPPSMYFAGAVGNRMFTWDFNGVTLEYIP